MPLNIVRRLSIVFIFGVGVKTNLGGLEELSATAHREFLLRPQIFGSTER